MTRIKRGTLLGAMIDYMRTHGGTARTADLHRAMESHLQRKVATSSVRGQLQNERYFERVERGEFRLQSGV